MNDQLLLTSLVRLESSSSKSLILVSFLVICAKRRKQNKVSNNCKLASLYRNTFRLPSSTAMLILIYDVLTSPSKLTSLALISPINFLPLSS